LARIHEAIRTGGRRLEVSRYTDGQAEHKQRVIRRLTRHNRSLVAPAPGYIDALENYPVTADRLQRMWDLTQARLSAGTGQATAQSLLSVINRTGLGGPWLNIHLFTDLLRRHTHFQILANGLVTQPPSACAGSTEHEAREYTREASPGSSTQDPAGSSTVPTSADVRPHELHDQRPDDGRFIDERPCSLA